jgi:hypothetical protein
MKNWSRLQEEIEVRVGAEQSLVAVVTWNEVRRQLICYSREIPAGALLNRLNLPVGTRVSYKTKREFPGTNHGYFVSLGEFQKKTPTNWQIALVGVEIDEENFSAIPFYLS